jgi:hypothetical protein
VVALVLVAVLLVGGGAAGYEGWTIKQHADGLIGRVGGELQAGADALTAGKAAVGKAASNNDPAPLKEATAQFEVARHHFRSARTVIDSDPLVLQAETFNSYTAGYVKPRREAVDNLSLMGLALADAGQDGADVDAQMISPANAQLRGGERLIATLNAVQPFMPKITADLQKAKKYADAVDASFLPSGQQASFLKSRSQISDGVAGALEFERLAPVLLEILGANGPRNYLVENIDPAELRAGGGFVGSYIMLGANKGQIKLGASGNVYDIDYPYPVKGQRTFVAPPNSLNEFATHGWVFGDSNFYPDFPASARVGQDLFKRETGKSVDGVIGIDFWAVAEMLYVTGPVAVPEYNVTVEAKTFPDVVVHRLLTEAGNVPGKKTFFPVVAAHVLDRLTSLGSGDWSNMIGHLNAAVTQRHMQVYFNNPPAQAEMGNIGWNGRQLAPSPGLELMQEVEANYGGNKANYWLQRKFNLELSYDNGKLTHKLSLSLKNQTPPGFEGGQDYRGYFRFYYPDTGTAASAGGLFPDKYPSDEKPIGLKLLDGWYQMTPMSTYEKVSFAYTTEVANLDAGHRIYWEKQPGTLSDKAHVVFKVGGRTYTLDTDLSQDRSLTLTNDGISVAPGLAGAAHLPLL